MKDAIIIGSTAGVLAGVVKDITEFVLGAIGLVPAGLNYSYVVTLILPQEQGLSAFARWSVYLVTHAGAAAFFGSILAYIYTRTEGRSMIFKGIGYGALLFIVHTAIFPKVWEPRLLPLLTKSNTIIWALIAHLGWGVLTGYLLPKVSDKETPKSSPVD